MIEIHKNKLYNFVRKSKCLNCVMQENKTYYTFGQHVHIVYHQVPQL